MDRTWVEQCVFAEGHDIIESKWDRSGRHVVFVRRATSLADGVDPDDIQRVVQVGDVERRSTLWTRACGRSSPVVSPDGLLLAHEDRGSHVLVRDIVTAKVLTEVDFSRFRGRIERITWNGNSSQIAVQLRTESMKLHVFDARSGEDLLSYVEGEFLGWNPLGTHLAIGFGDEVDLMNASSFTTVCTLPAKSPSFKWSPDGRWALISGHEDQALWVLDVLQEVPSCFKSMMAGYTMWSPDSTRILICQSETSSSSEPRNYLVLNASTGEIVHLLESNEPNDGVGQFRTLGMGWSPDSRKVSLVECGNVYDQATEDWIHRDQVRLLYSTGHGPHEVIPDAGSFIWSPNGDKGMACVDIDDRHLATVRPADDPLPVLVIEGSGTEVWDAWILSDAPNRLFAIQNVDRSLLEMWDPWEGHRIGSIPFTPDEVGHQEADFSTVIWSKDRARILIQRTSTTAEVWGVVPVINENG